MFILKIGFIGGCIFMFGWLFNLFKPSCPVETIDNALLIGKRVISEHFPNFDYDRYDITVNFNPGKDEWDVSCILKNSENIFCGKGPQVHIKRSNGRTTYERPEK